MIAMRRLKKLTRYLLGTSEVYQELCLDPRAEILQVPVDSDWADDKETRQSCSGGAALFHGCAVLTWATHTEDESSFERKGRVIRHWVRSNRRSGSSTTFARMAVQNSTAASDRLTERTCGGASEEGTAANGTTTYSHAEDSRQPCRLHDQGHDSRETDQVLACFELARIILHRLGPKLAQ